MNFKELNQVLKEISHNEAKKKNIYENAMEKMNTFSNENLFSKYKESNKKWFFSFFYLITFFLEIKCIPSKFIQLKVKILKETNKTIIQSLRNKKKQLIT